MLSHVNMVLRSALAVPGPLRIFPAYETDPPGELRVCVVYCSTTSLVRRLFELSVQRSKFGQFGGVDGHNTLASTVRLSVDTTNAVLYDIMGVERLYRCCCYGEVRFATGSNQCIVLALRCGIRVFDSLQAGIGRFLRQLLTWFAAMDAQCAQKAKYTLGDVPGSLQPVCLPMGVHLIIPNCFSNAQLSRVLR